MPKITNVQFLREFNGRDNRKFFISAITLDSGQGGEVMSTTPDRWKVGDECVVTSTGSSPQGQPTLKLSKPQQMQSYGGGENRSKIIDASWAVGQVLSMYGTDALDWERSQMVSLCRNLIEMRNAVINDA